MYHEHSASKAAVHHMNLSVSDQSGGLAEGTTSLCLAPVILDTPMNRKFMSGADFRYAFLVIKLYLNYVKIYSFIWWMCIIYPIDNKFVQN